MILTDDNVRSCPNCNSTELVKDYKRDELYCAECGLVLTSSFQNVGLEKIDNVIPFSAPASARSGIHTRYVHSDEKGKISKPNGTKYKHNIPDWKLMRFGRR